MKFDLFVFDMAGTTVEDGADSVAHAVREALEAVGVSIGIELVNPVMGIPKPLALRTLLTDARGIAPSEDEVVAVHADFQRRMIGFYRSHPDVREVPGASDLFRTLRSRGVRVALDTGFDRLILDTIVARLGWRDLIDDSAASDEVAHGRPAPDLIRALMSRARIEDATRVAKFGDSVSDIEEGFNAGCGFVGAILNDRTRPVLHRFPGAFPLESIDRTLAVMEAAGCGPFDP